MKTAKRHLACVTCILALLVGLVATPSAQAQTFQVLYTFTGGTDGALSRAALIHDGTGNLYGTRGAGGDPSCTEGGGFPGCGTVFEVSLNGTETVLHRFTGGTDGAAPGANNSLVRDTGGNLYGFTVGGGVTSCGGGCGTVFKVDPSGKETVLYSFTGLPDGQDPEAGLIRDAAGNLYRTTAFGGSTSCGNTLNGCGTVFTLDASGVETVLYRFGAWPDGNTPVGNLIRDAAGNLYGTTGCGGTYYSGTVFKLDVTGKEKIVYTFKGPPDGSNPQSLTVDSAGNLYGITRVGGTFNMGAVFKLDKTGKETILYSFSGGADGADPSPGLVVDSGNIYGAAEYGGDLSCSSFGSPGCGVVFKLNSAGTETVLYTFTAGADGSEPNGLVRGVAGNLYGTTAYAGDFSCQYGCGTVFVIKP